MVRQDHRAPHLGQLGFPPGHVLLDSMLRDRCSGGTDQRRRLPAAGRCTPCAPADGNTRRARHGRCETRGTGWASPPCRRIWPPRAETRARPRPSPIIRPSPVIRKYRPLPTQSTSTSATAANASGRSRNRPSRRLRPARRISPPLRMAAAHSPKFHAVTVPTTAANWWLFRVACKLRTAKRRIQQQPKRTEPPARRECGIGLAGLRDLGLPWPPAP